jgi:branched-chain amino acid transport system substrate-binding protein
MLTVEAIRTAQEKFGKGKPMTGEQVRWGYENLNLTEARLKELGFDEIIRPVKTSCNNHMGSSWARIHAWDGKKWNMGSEWYQADDSVIDPLIKEQGDKYLADKKIARRTDCK